MMDDVLHGWQVGYSRIALEHFAIYGCPEVT